MGIVDFALDDLHNNYVFSGHEYPLQGSLETTRQRRQRKIIVKEWGTATERLAGHSRAESQHSCDVVLRYLVQGLRSQQNKFGGTW